MPGKETAGVNVNFGQPEADKASKQNANPDFADNMGDIKPEYRDKAKEAFEGNQGSNKEDDDNERTNIDTGNRIGSN